MLTPVRPMRESVAPRPVLQELPELRPDPSRIAVLLNGNARRVTDRVARKLERIVGSDHVFRSRTLDEAEGFAREIVQRGYGTVVCGGGDGTLVRAVNLIHRYVSEANAWRVERYRRFGERQALITSPRFACLRLGTGNGMSRVVGSSDPIKDLERIVQFVPGRTRSIPLVEMEDERFFFGGVGYDSQVLDDYNWLKARARNPLLKMIMQNVTGYLLAATVRTVPRLVVGGDRVEARVVNRGRAFYIDPRRGDYAEPVEPGATLFEGAISIIGASTCPFFGFGFKMYPFARLMDGMMQLRISNLGPFQALSSLASAWKGALRNSEHIFDFVCEDVRVELSRPYPFQHSGDAQGPRDTLDLRIANDHLDLVDLYGPRRFT